MRGRLANTVRLRVAAETQSLIRLRAGPQTPSPKGEGISSQKLPPSLQNGYSPRPLHILWSHSLCGGILYVGAAFIVFSGRRGLCCARAGLAGHYPLDDVRSGRGLPLPFAKAGCRTAAAGRGRRPDTGGARPAADDATSDAPLILFGRSKSPHRKTGVPLLLGGKPDVTADTCGEGSRTRSPPPPSAGTALPLFLPCHAGSSPGHLRLAVSVHASRWPINKKTGSRSPLSVRKAARRRPFRSKPCKSGNMSSLSLWRALRP